MKLRSQQSPAKPFRIESLGRMAMFLLPSLKLKQRKKLGRTYEEIVHQFLMKHFGGYTASAGNIFGFWRDEGTGRDWYGEHREYKVSFRGRDRVATLQQFLSRLACDLDEETVYLEYGEDAWLVHARQPSRTRQRRSATAIPES